MRIFQALVLSILTVFGITHSMDIGKINSGKIEIKEITSIKEAFLPTFTEHILSQPPQQNDISVPDIQVHSPAYNISAVYYPFMRTWALYNPGTKKLQGKSFSNNYCRALTFHPTKPLMAILTKNGFVEIYDIEGNIITATDRSLDFPVVNQSLMRRTIDFSEDGKNLTVMVNEKCFIVSNICPETD